MTLLFLSLATPPFINTLRRILVKMKGVQVYESLARGSKELEMLEGRGRNFLALLKPKDEKNDFFQVHSNIEFGSGRHLISVTTLPPQWKG